MFRIVNFNSATETEVDEELFRKELSELISDKKALEDFISNNNFLDRSIKTTASKTLELMFDMFYLLIE